MANSLAKKAATTFLFITTALTACKKGAESGGEQVKPDPSPPVVVVPPVTKTSTSYQAGLTPGSIINLDANNNIVSGSIMVVDPVAKTSRTINLGVNGTAKGSIMNMPQGNVGYETVDAYTKYYAPTNVYPKSTTAASLTDTAKNICIRLEDKDASGNTTVQYLFAWNDGTPGGGELGVLTKNKDVTLDGKALSSIYKKDNYSIK